MAREEKYYCDFCEKEVWHQSHVAAVKVMATQWPQGWKSERDFANITWRHKEDWSYLICEDCAGEKININHGHDAIFSLSDSAKTLLRKLGFVKP